MIGLEVSTKDDYPDTGVAIVYSGIVKKYIQALAILLPNWVMMMWFGWANIRYNEYIVVANVARGSPLCGRWCKIGAPRCANERCKKHVFSIEFCV